LSFLARVANAGGQVAQHFLQSSKLPVVRLWNVDGDLLIQAEERIEEVI
jgi:hypothetical protein